MSLPIPISSLQEKDIETMEKKLQIELKPKKPSRVPLWKPPDKVNIVRKEGEYAMIPFHWGISYFGKKYRRSRQECGSIHANFTGQLRPEQCEIFNESLSALNRSATCLMAIYPGGGKCLGLGTRIRMASGSVQKVEQIRVGDYLLGDDDEPRRVLSIARGRETMYCVKNKRCDGMDYRVNESHIMTVMDKQSQEIVDIPLQTCLKNLQRYKGVYFDYRPGLVQRRHFVRRRLIIDEKTGAWLYPKSYIEEVMLSGLECVNDAVHPFCIRIRDPHNVFENIIGRVFVTYDLCIVKEEEDDYFGFELDGNRRFLLANGICTHNTVTSLCLASKIGLRTIILVNKVVLIDQWLETIRHCFQESVSVQVIQGSKTVLPGKDFYIINAINMMKRPFQQYQNLGIGLVIVDECHLMMTRIFSQALSYVCPRYLMGLSATPFRLDGYDALLELYFGLHRVVRKLYRPHTIYCIDSKIKIEHDCDTRGNIMWNSVIDKQTAHAERNQRIAHLCGVHHDRNILILSKRIRQIEDIERLLRENDQDVTVMKENENTFDKHARILIATFQKVGTGFSHNKLDMLILASDTEEYFIQYLGRVFRRPNVQPIVIDIVDRHPILKKHFQSRKKIYEESGGRIEYL